MTRLCLRSSRCTISSKKFAKSEDCSEATMAKKRKSRKTKAEREAWDAHVDETLRMLREAAERIQARGTQKRESA